MHIEWWGTGELSFMSYVSRRCPELLSMSPVFDDSGALVGEYEFVFESESHYHWFLLQQ